MTGQGRLTSELSVSRDWPRQIDLRTVDVDWQKAHLSKLVCQPVAMDCALRVLGVYSLTEM